MLILRPVAVDDLDDFVALAAQLDSANLPQDPDFLAERIATSVRSFAGDLEDPRDGAYVFVLEDTETERAIGTSMIIAKHGREGSPFYWLELSTEERCSPELERRFAAPQAAPAVHRRWTHRCGRPDPRPRLPPAPFQVRQGPLDRPLRLHLRSPGPLRARGGRRDALALRGAGKKPALERLRRALHGPPLPRGGPSHRPHQAVHRGSLSPRSGLRDPLPGRRAEGHR